MPKPHIKRPTAQEIRTILAPSTETSQVKLHKPIFEYLAANLDGEGAVSDYVSNRITSELVRLSKMKGGGNHSGWKVSNERRAANAKSRWAKTARRDSVKVRVFDEPHKAYLALCDNMQERTLAAADLIGERCESIDKTALLAYCAAHPAKPQRFITLPRETVDAVKVIANWMKVPFTKIICFVLEPDYKDA